MDEKTSPAPWRARVRGGVLEVVDATAGENLVCTANRLADADLIAKAPTLSAELAEAIELLDESRFDTEGTDFGDRVMRFLAKHGVK